MKMCPRVSCYRKQRYRQLMMPAAVPTVSTQEWVQIHHCISLKAKFSQWLSTIEVRTVPLRLSVSDLRLRTPLNLAGPVLGSYYCLRPFLPLPFPLLHGSDLHGHLKSLPPSPTLSSLTSTGVSTSQSQAHPSHLLPKGPKFTRVSYVCVSVGGGGFSFAGALSTYLVGLLGNPDGGITEDKDNYF